VPPIRPPASILLTLLPACVFGCDEGAAPDSAGAGAEPGVNALEEAVRTRVEGADGEVAVYYRALGPTDSVTVDADVRMHAASTMKVPVMIQLYRDADEGHLSLERTVAVDPVFHSIVDGSRYELPVDSAAEPGLYDRAGERVTIRSLVEPMIVWSSNLATNLLVREADPERVTATMRDFGADSIVVLRGVQDIPAFEAGLSNTTTARDLGAIMTALARGRAAGAEATEEMLDILSRQEFRSKIPAGVPEGVRVANKTGSITEISHDAAVVLPDDRPPYVLVVLTRGMAPGPAAEVARSVSEAVWAHHAATHRRSAAPAADTVEAGGDEAEASVGGEGRG